MRKTWKQKCVCGCVTSSITCFRRSQFNREPRFTRNIFQIPHYLIYRFSSIAYLGRTVSRQGRSSPMAVSSGWWWSRCSDILWRWWFTVGRPVVWIRPVIIHWWCRRRRNTVPTASATVPSFILGIFSLRRIYFGFVFGARRIRPKKIAGTFSSNKKNSKWSLTMRPMKDARYSS